MSDRKNKGEPGFWRRNWLSLAVVCALSWTGWYYWWMIMRFSPYLIILHTLFTYLFLLKFLYDNHSSCDNLFDELRDGGWKMIKTLFRVLASVWGKLVAGADLITRRLGVEQELVIAEKQKKKLEIELSRRKLHDELLEAGLLEPVELSHSQVVPMDITNHEDMMKMETERKEIIPPYAQYAPILTAYLAQVRWEVFTATQAQLVLRKRYGTVKLVLEELVEQRVLEYVKLGKRIAYRLVETKNN